MTSLRSPVPSALAPCEVVGSRRLTGPNLYHVRPGAVLEVITRGVDAQALAARWRAIAGTVLHRVGWENETTVVRHHTVGVHLFTTAPLDGLLAATELNELAWSAAEAVAMRGETPRLDDLVARVRVSIQHDRRPGLTALANAARERGLSFTFDDESVSVGSGDGARAWPLDRLPAPADVAWDAVHDVPIVLVTGSNGKTTTTRLIAAMLRASGRVVGLTSTDGVQIGAEGVAEGDYAGPAGARLVLRDRRVGAAVLETARGGILRRGLATPRADVAVVTHVAADHFGDYGIDDLRALAEVKLVVAKVIARDGRVVLNADDPALVDVAPRVGAPIVWFSLFPGNPTVVRHLARGGEACLVKDEALVFARGDRETPLARAVDIPISLGGNARYNLANTLAASAAALSLDVGVEAVRETLLSFGADPADNPGRLTLLEWNGATIVVDFVHNPDGWHALYEALGGLPARRRLILLGQAGDRDDAAVRELARAAWSGRPDLVVLKEMPDYLRGRPSGETTAILAAELRALGIRDDALVHCDDEQSAIGAVLDRTAAGDLVILAVHSDYPAAMDVLTARGARPRLVEAR